MTPGWSGADSDLMTTATLTERGRLTALRAAWLFDGMSSALVHDPLVVIDGGTIVTVDSGVAAPDGVDLVDLDGAALLPGLIDTHVHLAFDAGPDPVGALADRDDEAAAAAMIRAGQTALRGGVTTVRDLGDRDYLSLGLRGRPGLPTIVAAGPPVTTPAGTATTWAGWRNRPRPGCGPRCASTWSAASTSSRSWPAAGA